jgi:hypothetical protein
VAKKKKSVPPPKGAPVKKKVAPKKRRDLTKAEAFYVEAHHGQKTPEVLAAELGAPVESVRKYAAELDAAGFKPPERPNAAQRAGFAIRAGTVSMTPASSVTGDEFRGVTADGPKPEATKEREEGGKEFLRRRVPSIHIIELK